MTLEAPVTPQLPAWFCTLSPGTPRAISYGMKHSEALASVWDGIWFAYISALRSGSKTRIALAKKEVDAFNANL